MTRSQIANLDKFLDTIPTIWRRSRWTVAGEPTDHCHGYGTPKHRLYLDIGKTAGVWGRMYVDLIEDRLVTEMSPELRVTHAVEIAAVRLWLRRLPKLQVFVAETDDGDALRLAR